MSKYNIKPNEVNGGECCYFTHRYQEYYADKAYTPDFGEETMIFLSKDKHVTSWSDLYCDRSGKSLEECIDEFIASLD